MKRIAARLLPGFILLVACSCNKDEAEPAQPVASIVAVSGDITTGINEFRNLLGATLNTTPGHSSGRREINWDGVPAIYESQDIPADFFNPVAAGASTSLQRGFHYTGLAQTRISSQLFANLEPSLANEFTAFSGNKTFSAVGSNLWNVDFQVPGQLARASVHGFGAVFSDVDVSSSTSIEFFSFERSLGVYQVPVRSAGSLSFLGVYFPNEKVTGIRFRQGNAVVANGLKDISSGGAADLVLMDDFLYDEPQGL